MEKLKELIKQYARVLDADETLELHREIIRFLSGEFSRIPFTRLEIAVMTAALKYIAQCYESLLSERDVALIKALNSSLTSYAGVIPAGEVKEE